MKIIFLTVAIFVLFGINTAQAQINPSPDTLTLRFPKTIDMTDLSINYYMVGGFGGYGSFVGTQPKIWDYVIETSAHRETIENNVFKSSEKKFPAESFKAIIYRPKYGVKLIDIASLIALKDRNLTVNLEPLGEVHLSGKINFPENHNLTNLKLNIQYNAYWAHDFFGIIDGMVSTFEVTSTGLAKDGSFSVMLPDFAHDSVINRFGLEDGEFEFTVRENKTGNIPYDIKNLENTNGRAKLKVAEQYGKKLILTAKPQSK